MRKGHAILWILLVGSARGLAAPAPPKAPAFAPPLYVFENGVRAWPPAEAARILKALGYHAIGSASPRDLAQKLKAYDAAGIALTSIYAGARIGPGGATYDPLIPKAIAILKGRRAFVELTITGSAPDGDAQAVAVVREIADRAAAAGLRVALYPHTGLYIARVADAVRIAKKVGRKNVGVMFNLCHFLRLQRVGELEGTIAEAAPYLVRASTCGADVGGRDWKALIQPLDRGTFDQLRLLRALRKHGFRGAVGLQCYGMGGDPRENLRRSRAAWRRLLGALGTPRSGAR